MNIHRYVIVRFVLILIVFCILITSCETNSFIHYPTAIYTPTSTTLSTSTYSKGTAIIAAPTITTRFSTSTVTPDIIQTVIPLTTATLSYPLINNRYIVMSNYNQNLYLVEITNGKSRNIESKDVHPIRLISFVDKGCNLVVLLNNKSIDQIDLQANVVKQILPVNWHNGSEWVYGETINNSMNWIAYNLGYGRQGYNSWEIQDLETMNLSNNTVFRISEYGGAGIAEWKLDGSQIAFSDFDNHKYYQIYMSNADGTNKTQLTQFREEKIDINTIKWSPDGDKLAFVKSNPSNGIGTLGIIFMNIITV